MRRLHQIPPIKAQRSMRKRRCKDCMSQKLRVTPRKQCLLDAEGLMQIQTVRNACSMFKPDVVPALEIGKWTQGPTPNLEAICDWYLLAKRKISFLKWSATGHLDHTPRSTPCSEIGHHKINSMVLFYMDGLWNCWFCLFICASVLLYVEDTVSLK